LNGYCGGTCKWTMSQAKYPSMTMAIMEVYNKSQPMYNTPVSFAYPHAGNVTNIICMAGNVRSIKQGKVPTDSNQSFWKPTNQWMKNTWL